MAIAEGKGGNKTSMDEGNEKESTVKPLLIGLAAGAAAGALLSILFAPRSGKETRRRIPVWGRRLPGKSNVHWIEFIPN